MVDSNLQSRDLQTLYRSGSPTPTAMIYQGELDFISQCILDYPNIETGGQLFGFWTAAGTPVVLYAIGPGPRANHQVAFFNQDIEYLTRIGSILTTKFGLQHIGEWHSHHQLGLAQPSGHDAATLVHGISRQNLGRFLLCIGTCTEVESVLNAFNFTQDSGYDFVHAAWDVKSGASPYRVLVDNDELVKSFLSFPATTCACHGNLKLYVGQDSFTPPSYNGEYWLKNKANNKVLKDIVDDLSKVTDNHRCGVQMDTQKLVHLVFSQDNHEMRVIFPNDFPDVPPLIMRDGIDLTSTHDEWSYSGDIHQSFVKYIEKLTHKTEAIS